MRSNFLCKKLLVFIITVSMLAMLVTACGPKEDAELSEDAEKSEGVEIWAKKDDGGRIHFSTSLDKDQIEEVSPSLAKRFAETSVSK